MGKALVPPERGLREGSKERGSRARILNSDPDFCVTQVQAVSQFPQLTNGDNNSPDRTGIVCSNCIALREQGSELCWAMLERAPKQGSGWNEWVVALWLSREKCKLMSLSPSNEDLLSYWTLAPVTQAMSG